MGPALLVGDADLGTEIGSLLAKVPPTTSLVSWCHSRIVSSNAPNGLRSQWCEVVAAGAAVQLTAVLTGEGFAEIADRWNLGAGGGVDGKWGNYLSFCDPDLGELAVFDRMEPAFDSLSLSAAAVTDLARSAEFIDAWPCGGGFAASTRDERVGILIHERFGSPPVEWWWPNGWPGTKFSVADAVTPARGD